MDPGAQRFSLPAAWTKVLILTPRNSGVMSWSPGVLVPWALQLFVQITGAINPFGTLSPVVGKPIRTTCNLGLNVVQGLVYSLV